MDAKLQRRIQRYGWDRASALYEHSWQTQLAPAHSKLLDLAAIGPGSRVVDVACGTGLITFAAAAAAGRTGAVVGTDLSQAMIDRGRVRAQARGFGHVRFERMDAEDLSLPDASCDAALNALGLMYVPDARKAVAEMARVLSPGGRAVAVVWGRRSRCGWAQIFPIVDAQVRSEVCPLFFALGTADTLGAIFRDTGFTGVVTETIETRLEWPSAEEACGAAFAGGPVALAYSRFDEPTRQIVRREYLASIEPWKAGSGYAVPGEFVVVAGRKP